MKSRIHKTRRIEQLKRYIEEVIRAGGIDETNAAETEICVDKDRDGLPGEVVITVTRPDRKEHWKRNLNGWYVYKTEHPQ